MKKDKTTRLVVSAMMIAVGTAISLLCEWIPFLNLPFGGTITIASMLPLVVASYLYGVRWGLGCGLVFGILQMAVGFRTVSALFLPSDEAYMGIGAGAAILLLDYLLAYTAVGLGGLFRRRTTCGKALVWGSVTALLIRYFCHVLSGAIFYGAFAEWFFVESAAASFAFSHWIMQSFSGGGLALIYSLVYNACYMLPEILITAVAALSVSRLPQIKSAVK